MAWLTETLFRRILNWAGKIFGKKGHTGLAVLLFRAGQQPDDFSHALALWHEKQHDDAEAVLVRLLSKTPGHAEANNLMGAIYLRRGQDIEAEPFIRNALAFRENYAAAQNNLGNVFLARNALHDAADCYRAALVSDENYAEALTNLGGVLTSLGNYSEAERFCRRAIQVAPKYAGAHCNLGSVLLSLGRGGEAIAAYRKALDLVPDLPEALINLSLVLQDPGYLVGVVDYYEARLKKWPGDYQSHLRIAQALQAQDRWDDGRDQIMRALDVRSEAPDALLLLGHNHAHAGDAHSAIECYRRVLTQGANSAAHSGIIFNLLYLNELTGESLREEFESWAERYAPARTCLPSVADLDTADRPLRIGYVSKDFALHSVAYFLEPILAHHDSGRVFSVCYSTQLQPDVMTARFQGMAGLWRDVSMMSIDELEQTVHQDRIDILVDLSGHTSGHRLELFSRRPAPVQVTYLGHPSTTGLSAIDYRIGDSITDPPGMTEIHYTEKLWHLPGCFLTYRPPEGNLEPKPAPCLSNRYITFGSFNNALKITSEVLTVWAKILLAVPESRIVLKSYAFSTQPGKDRVLGTLVGLGVDSGRIQLMDWLPTGGGHLSIYNNVDISLDPFPYNGTTTTCESLWMGVPVICLVGNRHSGRVGASLLTTLGLTELLAKTQDEYVEIAVKLAANPDQLVELRECMRGRMLVSPLLNHSAFTCQLEEAYRTMWELWSAKVGDLYEENDEHNKELRLHIGGQDRKDGWTVLNINYGPNVDIVGDIKDLSTFGSGSVVEIYASHVLEHIDQQTIPMVLRELRRILRKPGGKLMISVPDLEILCQLFLRKEIGSQGRLHVMRMIFGGQVDDNDYHEIGLYFEYLKDLLESAGFHDVERVKSFGLFEDTSDYAPYGTNISLNVVAIA